MESKDHFISKKPKNIFLQQYISYYYFHQTKDEKLVKRFVYYPNYKNALTIYKHSSIKLKDGFSSSFPDTSKKYTFTYSNLLKQCHKVEMKAPFDKIGIVFQVLGINHFIPTPLSEHIKEALTVNFSYFEKALHSPLEKVYASDDIDEKVHILDTFFLSQFVGFKEKRLEKAISFLLKKENKYSVQSLSDELHISRKTLLRLFQKHMVCNAKDYMNLIRFRNAIHMYQTATKKPALTQLAYHNDYYDQSEFVNHFKKVTGFNPKKMFQKISHIGNEDTFWTFES